jgi:hypothetical protein
MAGGFLAFPMKDTIHRPTLKFPTSAPNNPPSPPPHTQFCLHCPVLSVYTHTQEQSPTCGHIAGFNAELPPRQPLGRAAAAAAACARKQTRHCCCCAVTPPAPE